MRPNTIESGGEVYECFECGNRIESPTGRVCGSCGGTLRNIARSRDL